MSNQGGSKIMMVRENFNDLPDFQLPLGYAYQWYQPGMANDWVRIQKRAEPFLTINFQNYENEFGMHHEELMKRQCFIKNSKNELIGTATAWFDSGLFGEGFGRVHWVAIVPEEQGKKLSNCLLSNILFKLKELQYKKAYLATSSKRLGAIYLYLKFGFVPVLEKEEDINAWSEYLSFKKKYE